MLGRKKGIAKRPKSAPKVRVVKVVRQPKVATKKEVEKVAQAVEKKEEAKGYAPGLLGGIGGLVGGTFFGGAGATVGSSIGNWLGKITGMGAYKVNGNTLIGGNVPTFGQGAGTTLCHREYIGDVSGSVAFTNTSYAINPGQSGLFPWLSLCAAQFEEYQLLGMIVEFKSTSANALNSTNTALGTVILATDYDTYDSAFANKQQMEAYEFSTSAPPSVSQLHPIECDPKKNVMSKLYVRSGSVPAGADQRFYDVGNFQIATVGMQAAAVIGELWVTYHVKFMKPKIPTPLGQNLACGRWSGSNHSAAAPFTNLVAQSGNTLSPTISGVSVSNLPLGRYIAIWSAHCDSCANCNVWAAIAGCSTGVSTAWPNATTVSDASLTYTTGIGVTGTVQVMQSSVTFDVTSAVNTMNLQLGTFTNGASYRWKLYIVQISSGLSAPRTLAQRLADLEAIVDANLDDCSVRPPPSSPVADTVCLTKEQLRRFKLF